MRTALWSCLLLTTIFAPQTIVAFMITTQAIPLNCRSNLLRIGKGVLVSRKLTPGAFEPKTPDVFPSLIVLTSTFGLAAYWWMVFVPSERRDLAKNKNKGGLNDYLDSLESSEGRGLEKWFYTEWLERRRKSRKSAAGKSEEQLADEATANAAKTPSFLSLDNPVIIGFTILLSGVLYSFLSTR